MKTQLILLLIIVFLSWSLGGFTQKDERLKYKTYLEAFTNLTLEENMGREVWAYEKDKLTFKCSDEICQALNERL